MSCQKWENMVDVHKVNIIVFWKICWLHFRSLEVWGIVNYYSSKVLSHNAGTDILETPIKSTTYITQDHSCITTLNREALLYRKITSTGTFCDNCSAEDNDKRNVII